MQAPLQVFTSSGPTLQLAPGQACDQCRKRKARCNREHPCVHCLKTRQTCSYDQAPKTRGRKSRRKAQATTTNDGVATQHIVAAAAAASGDVARSWTGTLPDLTLYNASGMSGIMGEREQQLPMTPASATASNLPTSCVVSTPLLDSHFLKPHSQDDDTWCDSLPPVDISPQLLSRECFVPYVRLFLDRLYPVHPIVDKEHLLGILETPELHSQPLPSSLYTFLTALSAAVVTHLNLRHEDVSGAQADSSKLAFPSTPLAQVPLSTELLVAECLATRKNMDFIENADEWTILTSFFLFNYHGNLDQPRSAWYYLREAIGFAQTLGLDDPEVYLVLDPETAQRRRLLFWLLFVTERAYALQRRNRVTLQSSISLPHVFESPEPKLMYGFVTLARVFSTVDNAFITAWRYRDTPMLVRASGEVGQALGKLLREAAEVNDLEAAEINETQRLDILVTKQWLKTLAWQLQCSLDAALGTNSIDSRGRGGGYGCTRDSPRVIEASKSLLQVIHAGSAMSLEAHGIGLEQKVSDVAHCLCDVMERSDEPEVALEFFSTQDFLHQFMIFLADFRRHESQYLQPLLQRAARSLSCFVEPRRALTMEEGREEEHVWLVEEAFLDERLDCAYSTA